MKLFRIMDGTTVQAVPYRYALKFEQQALKNHSQTIEKLNERGGLSPEEFYCVANGIPFKQAPTRNFAIGWLHGEQGLLMKSEKATTIIRNLLKDMDESCCCCGADDWPNDQVDVCYYHEALEFLTT